MSHDASTTQVRLNSMQDELSASSSPQGMGLGMESVAGNVAVESYADRLMDDLFADVEQLLGGESRSPKEPELEERQPIADLPSPKVESVSEGMPLAPRSQPEKTPDTIINQPSTSIEQPPSTSIEPASLGEKVQRHNLVYDRFLLAIGCVSLLATLAMWLLFQEARRPSTVANVAITQTVEPVTNAADQQFADYVQRSLQMIDQKTAASAPPAASALPSTSGLPSVSVPPTLTPPTSNTATSAPRPGTSTGLSKLYSPFYQSAQGASTRIGFPFTVTPSVVPLPTMPSRTATAPVNQPIPLSVPGVARTLVGVVEMGDQSAVLVEINGVAQRFKLGESIGSSGWTLVEVSKNQALVRRNGEVRSVFIGQSF